MKLSDGQFKKLMAIPIIKHKRLKVFSGCLMHHGKQLNTIVATHTQKEAAKLLGISLYELRNYWSETGNDIEINVATSKPGVVFWASSYMGYDLKEKGN